MIRHEIAPFPVETLALEFSRFVRYINEHTDGNLQWFMTLETLKNFRRQLLHSSHVEPRLHRELILRSLRVEHRTDGLLIKELRRIARNRLTAIERVSHEDRSAVPTIRRLSELLRRHKLRTARVHRVDHALDHCHNWCHKVRPALKDLRPKGKVSSGYRNVTELHE